jgi:hypothetical protein
VCNGLLGVGGELTLVRNKQRVTVTACYTVAVRACFLEYLNTYDVLVIVLEAAPCDVDPATGDVCEKCVKCYRHFFLKPERHDCVEPAEGPGVHFSCSPSAC